MVETIEVNETSGLSTITVVGGGLAGCEAALQLAKRGIPVRLIEMKPTTRSPAHVSEDLAELVCSNSFRSDDVTRAPGLLKEEMRRARGALIHLAEGVRVPAGAAMAVDRDRFSHAVTEVIQQHPLIELVRQEAAEIPDGWVILATGPLTSQSLTEAISTRLGARYLHFYDAIAPIVDAQSVDGRVVWAQSRYDKGEGRDYLNCPLDRATYERFVSALVQAEKVPLRSCEEARFFEGCLPIEVMAERGRDVLRFGPFKPVGLCDPRTGEQPYAVAQLRRENLEGTAYNLVGCQTRLKWPEQRRLFRMVPGLETAVFLRLGSVHRNTFINAPQLLRHDWSVQEHPTLHFAGQITGVEGYIESMASGLLAGIALARKSMGLSYRPPPSETALGALTRHVTGSLQRPGSDYQPSNIHFGMFPALPGRPRRRDRRSLYVSRALHALEAWLHAVVNDESDRRGAETDG